MDATKNVINNQKKHQIPEKTQEQIDQEKFMKESPSRAEMSNYIEGYVQNSIAAITNSFNVVFGVLQQVLVAKGLVTAEELEKAGEEAIKSLSESTTSTGANTETEIASHEDIKE